MNSCISCQSELVDAARFCWNCGESQPMGRTAPTRLLSVEHSGIRAEVSTARIPSGEWVALGSVVASPRSVPLLHPAWVIVGTGISEESAVDDLRGEMQRRSDQLRRPESPLNDVVVHTIPAI